MDTELLYKSIYDKFILGMNYTHPDGERYFGFITRNPEYTNKTFLEDEAGFYVVFDLLSKKWLKIPNDDTVTFTFYNIDVIDLEDPYRLVFVNDLNLIQKYNENNLLKFQEKKNKISKIIEDTNIELSEEQSYYYKSLPGTHHFPNLPDKYLDIIALLVVSGTTLTSFIDNKPTDIELENIRNNWLTVIGKHIEIAKNRLDCEIKNLDKDSEDYNFEIEEIEMIKNLLDSLREEYSEKLKDCQDYPQVFSTWPPLLLPAPSYCCHINRINTIIDEKYRS